MALVGGLYLFLVSGRLFGRDDDAREVKHGVPTIAEPLIESGQVGDAQLFAERRPLAPLKAIIALATFAGAIALAARSEEHTSELQSLMRISYAVFCLKKKKQTQQRPNITRNSSTS